MTVLQHGCVLEALSSERRRRERKPSLQNPTTSFIAEVAETKLWHPNVKKSVLGWHPSPEPLANRHEPCHHEMEHLWGEEP